MAFYLASKSDRHLPTNMMRFDPRFWTVNFPRPCNASIVTTGPSGMKVDCALYYENSLAGLIWESEDKIDHPLLGFDTSKDYSGCTLTFNWSQTGLILLDAFNGATLTIEGRDSSGAAHTWYVRLWNYKTTGTNTNATFVLNFDVLDGGFFLPADADRVWPYDIDRMFISMVAPAYNKDSLAALAAPVYGAVTITNLVCSGGQSYINLYNAGVANHGFKIATGYDDSYNITPERMLRNITSLGYAGTINHYVGMSHYYRMVFSAGQWIATSAGGALNPVTNAWHADFFARAKALGFEVIISLSFEMLNENCPPSWRQLDSAGQPALTGWDPPSSLLSPTNTTAQAYLQAVALAFCALASTATLTVRFQIGEPWWWSDFRTFVPCFYDPTAVALYLAETGLAAPAITDMRSPMNAAQLAYLDWAGGKLGAATIALRNAVKGVYPAAITYLLFYAPQVQQTNTPELYRANRPTAWNSPAFDFLQLEDYDFVIEGRVADTATAAATVTTTMGYPVNKQNYFSGFVLNAADAGPLWALINDAAEAGKKRAVPDVYFWALPQVMRDGFVIFTAGASTVRAWTFSRDGHDFYVLNLGSDCTLVYDALTQQWSEWVSIDRSVWRVISGLNWYELTVAGDDTGGILWSVDPDYNIDDDNLPIISKLIGGLPARGAQMVPCNGVYLAGSVGNGASGAVNGPPSGDGNQNASSRTVRLRTSDNNGETWIDHGERSVNSEVNADNELAWRSLGLIQAPGRVFEITDNGLLARIDGLDME